MDISPHVAASHPVCVVCARPADIEIGATMLCARHGLYAMIDGSIRQGFRTAAEWRDDIVAAGLPDKYRL